MPVVDIEQEIYEKVKDLTTKYPMVYPSIKFYVNKLALDDLIRLKLIDSKVIELNKGDEQHANI